MNQNALFEIVCTERDSACRWAAVWKATAKRLYAVVDRDARTIYDDLCRIDAEQEAEIDRLKALLAEYERLAEYVRPILCEQAEMFPTLAKKHVRER